MELDNVIINDCCNQWYLTTDSIVSDGPSSTSGSHNDHDHENPQFDPNGGSESCCSSLSLAHQQVQLRDIGTYMNKESHDKEEVYKFLTGVWRPDKRFLFPKKDEYGKKRAFNYEWLQKYPWLSYSALMDGAYCLPCVLFTKEKNGKKRV